MSEYSWFYWTTKEYPTGLATPMTEHLHVPNNKQQCNIALKKHINIKQNKQRREHNEHMYRTSIIEVIIYTRESPSMQRCTAQAPRIYININNLIETN